MNGSPVRVLRQFEAVCTYNMGNYTKLIAELLIKVPHFMLEKTCSASSINLLALKYNILGPKMLHGYMYNRLYI